MISVRDLRMVFPNGHEALRSVSFNIDRGEFVCIIGRSGAGKSTLLRCLNGLLVASGGQIVVDGTDVTTAGSAERQRLRRRIGFIFQEYNLVERLSVISNVLAGRLGHRSPLSSSLFWFARPDREIALRSLERVNLGHKARQRADPLSGGEKQRVAIARALTQEPVAVPADEPVASLDPELAWSVMTDLRRTAKESGIPTLVNIPNGPYAVNPQLDTRAVKKMQEAFGGFTDRDALKTLELVGPLIPADTSMYNFVRQTAKLLNLEFDEKGAPKPVGGSSTRGPTRTAGHRVDRRPADHLCLPPSRPIERRVRGYRRRAAHACGAGAIRQPPHQVCDGLVPRGRTRR